MICSHNRFDELSLLRPASWQEARDLLFQVCPFVTHLREGRVVNLVQNGCAHLEPTEEWQEFGIVAACALLALHWALPLRSNLETLAWCASFRCLAYKAADRLDVAACAAHGYLALKRPATAAQTRAAAKAAAGTTAAGQS